MTEPRTTDEDVRAAVESVDNYNHAPNVGQVHLYATQLRFALESAYRPGGIVDRAVAAELDQLAQDAANTGTNPDPGFLLWLANERREGRRDDD